MAQKAILLTALILSLLLAACNGGRSGRNGQGGDTIPLRYARNLTMVQYADHLEVVLRNPWDTTQELHRYTFRQPLRKVAVFTSVHCALLQELGAAGAVRGVCDLQYINLPYIKKGIKDGTIRDLGNGMEPSLEGIMDLQPDALLISPFENSGGYGRLESLGIPIVETADYMEKGPLARAEWIRLYGRLFGQAGRADSLFSQIEKRYLSLRQKARKAATHPRLLCEMPYSGQWYMPGRESTMGLLYHDAGARYLFSDIPGTGSTPVSLEQVLDRGLTADVWLLKHNGPLTRAQLVQDTPLLRQVKARIWVCDTDTSGYYEQTPFHPDLLLENLMEIFHPELGIHSKKMYFCPLE